MLCLLEAFRCLWSLFLACFRVKSKEDSSTTVLPVSSKGKTGATGNSQVISPRHEWKSIQQRDSGLAAGSEKGTDVRHPTLSANSNLRAFYLPLNRLPSTGHPQPQDKRIPSQEYFLVPHSGPPSRPPRPRSVSVASGVSDSEDEFNTPVIPNVHLPAVIVTPCTPSSEASRTHIGSIGTDESSSDENGASSGSDTCITSFDSNPFLIGPSSPIQKAVDLPLLGAINYRRRARSLTGTGRGLQHQRLTKSDSFVLGPSASSSLPLVADGAGLSNPVKKLDIPALIENSVSSSASEISLVPSRLRFDLDYESQAITDQPIRSYMAGASSKKSEGSADQMLAQNDAIDTPGATVTATLACPSEEDSEAYAFTSSDEDSGVITLEEVIVVNQIRTLSRGGHNDARLGAVPYPEVFDLDAYFDSDSSSPSQSTMQSSLKSSYSTSSSPSSMPPTPSPICPSSTIFVSQPEPLQGRISNVTDTTASSTSVYALSLSNMSTDTDESASSNLRLFGSRTGGSYSRRSSLTFDREASAKRYRDQYRPHAYSRSPAFVVESPTTSKKFMAKRGSDEMSDGSSNKENESVGSVTSDVSSTSEIVNSNPTFLVRATTVSQTLRNAPVRHYQQDFKQESQGLSMRGQPTVASTTSVGKNLAILGSVAISQRRQMDIFL